MKINSFSFHKYVTKEYIFLFGLCLLGFFIRAIPHLFIIPFLGVEEGSILYFAKVLNTGNFMYISKYPHFHIIFIVCLHRLTTLPLERVMFFWSPFVGSLSIFVVYHIAKSLNYNIPILTSFLLTFLDIHIYRTTYTNSSESTAILIFLIFLYFFIKKKTLYYIPILFLLPFAHLLPFIIGVCLLFVNLVLPVGQLRKRWKHSLIFLLGLCIVGIVSLSGYGLAQLKILQVFDKFNLRNLYILYNFPEFVIILTTLLGSSVLFLVNFIREFRRRGLLLQMNCIMLVFIFFFWLFYLATVISPFRVLVYIGLVSVISFSSIKLSKKTVLFVVVIAVVMLISVSTNGWREHNHLSYNVTKEEIIALEWLREYDEKVNFFNLVYDDTGMETVVALYKPLLEPFSNESTVTGVWRSTDITLFIETEDVSVLDPYTKEYGIYSQRVGQAWVYRRKLENGRIDYFSKPMPDVWKNVDKWMLIYDKQGVKIYARKLLN